MFGFRPPSSVPSNTPENNVPQTTTSGFFQQNQPLQSLTSFPTPATTTTPAFGLFQQQQGINSSNSTFTAAGQPPAFQFTTTSKGLLPTPTQSEIQSKTSTNVFKSPQFGSIFEKPSTTQESSNKNLFSLPNVSGTSQSNPFLQTAPTFSFNNPTSGSTLFPSAAPTESTKSVKQVTFSFSNPDKGLAVRPGASESSVPTFSSKASNAGAHVFSDENVKPSGEGNKPIFSFVKAKDVSEHAKTSSKEDDPRMKKGVLKLDEEMDTGPKKKPGIKSRLSLPLKAPALRVSTDKSTKSKSLKSPTAEEISKITSIVCREIPDKYNNKQFIVNHFSKFGNVKSTRWNSKKKHVTVTFPDHASARAAKTEGCFLGPNEPKMVIFWATLSPRKKSEPLSEVDKELQSMGGTGFTDPQLLARPEGSGKEVTKKRSVSKKSTGAAADESLLTLVERTATNCGERFDILDARDKLMRMKLQKQSDICKAIAIVGTCPDMCPEKERYSRTEKNGLSLFELHHSDTMGFSTSNMNPKAVVKEYSRSSADQEEPLSHELRPPQVLNMTMDYLLCNIMDVSSNAGEWFDFIWNRTRAIRKDITQQHLCDPLCVTLVEKCARFHIHCAAAFCHEDISVFDPKINNENLTKCLQTLKHFYHDLSEKGIFCPNEAEFVTYDILLNLNEGDTIRQVQTFRKDIRDSDSVHLATEIFFAQSSNNYVRFFRLVRKASYLNACILQRYFPEVRRKAFSAICRAYRNEQFPITGLIELLAFEDIEEVEQYCEWLNLQTEAGVGILLRKFVRPSTSAPSIIRPCNLINKKRLSTVGAVVNGGALPDNPYLIYQPHDSFDASGKLKKNAYDAQDQYEKVNAVLHDDLEVETKPSLVEFPYSPQLDERAEQKPVIPVVSYTPPVLSLPPATSDKPDKAILDKAAREIMTDITTETVQPITFQIAQESMAEAEEKFSSFLAKQATATIVVDVVSEISREICEDVLQEAVFENQQREEQEYKMKAYTESMELLCDEVLLEDMYIVAEEAILEGRQEHLDTLSNDIQSFLLSEFLTEECTILVNHVVKEERVWTKKIQDFILRKRNDRARKIFLRWHCKCVNRRTLENIEKSFPSGPFMGYETAKRIKLDGFSCLPVHSQATQLEKDSKLLLADLYYSYLNGELSGLHLNVLNLVKDTFMFKRPFNTLDGFMLWKLLIFTPSSEKLNPWVNLFRNKFSVSSQEPYNTLQENLWSSQPNVNYWECSTLKLGVSTLHVSGHPSKSVKGDILRGMSALLLPINLHVNSADIRFHLHMAKKGLYNLLHGKASIPSVPVAILLFTDDSDTLTAEQEKQLLSPAALDVYSSGLISRTKIFYIFKGYSSAEIDAKIKESILWLAQNTSELPNLASSYLDGYIEDGLRMLVLDPMFQDLAYKQKCFNSSFQSPDAILSLYNAAIQFLGEVLCSSHLQDISWPAPEFAALNPSLFSSDWNRPHYLQKVKNLLRNLKIDESLHRTSHPYTSQEAHDWIETIKGQLTPSTRSVFIHMFQRELSRLEASEISAVPWATILLSLFSLLLSDFRVNLGEENALVRYKLSDMQNFQLPTTWLESTRDSFTEELNKQSMTLSQHNVPLKMEEEAPKEQITESTCSPLQLGPEYYQTSDQRKALQASQELNLTLQEERRKSHNYTQWLKALSAEEQDSLSPSSIFNPVLFDLPSLSEQKVKTPEKRKSLSDNLDDSFYVVQRTLRNEKESSNAFHSKLRLLQL